MCTELELVDCCANCKFIELNSEKYYICTLFNVCVILDNDCPLYEQKQL